MSDARVEVLGPLRLLLDGIPTHVGGRRQQMVLALLAAHLGRQVSDDRLVDELWGQEPPASATGSLQVAVSRLRKVLGSPDRLRREANGYVLSGVDLDADELSRAAADVAAAEPAAALDLTASALAGWRGQPFGGLDASPTLAQEATRLVDDRLRLVEARAEAHLALGDPEAAARTLTSHLADHPYRERLWSTLALARYRGDRQAEALDTLRRLREALVDGLGVDPSPSVRELEARILAQDPDLAGPVAPSSPDRGSASDLVGRDDAREDLDDVLARLASGRGGVVLLTGEAGIGKSALAADLAARARSTGVRVVVGRCHEADLAPAYWPWLPVLRDLAAETDGSAAVPTEVAALLGDPAASTVGADGPEAAAAATLRTFAAVSRLLGVAARPLVVTLEDLHWADQTSLRLLSYVVEDLADRPVLVVATLRPVDPHRHAALARGLADLGRLQARRIPVGPLPEPAVGALAATVLEGVDEPLVRVLADRSDGNPFFVLELARLLAQRGQPTAAEAASLEVPDGIADVLRLRLLLLSEGARGALDTAAVVGREFDPALLTAAGSGAGLDDLDEARARGLVVEQGSGFGSCMR